MTAYYLKDANGNQFPVTSTPIGPQAGASAICTTPASDAVAEPGGAAITGASMPAGGVGLTGWLSAIWKAITGTLAISKPVAPASATPDRVLVGTGATLIVAARTGAVGVGRASVTFYNNGLGPVFLGPSGVTTATGFPLPARASESFDTTAAFYGVAATGSQDIAVMETY